MKKFFLCAAGHVYGAEEAMAGLLAGTHRHDVLEATIRQFETNPADDSVGYGGFPNLLGDMELDAAFMDGDGRTLGAVAGVKNFLPVRIARRLMGRGLHTLLAGAGAEIFARECGLQPEPTLSPEQRVRWEREVKPLLDARGSTPLMDLVERLAAPKKKETFDTVVMIASDGNGISAAASTSGWSYKFPGRAGDTPVSGGGFYVDSLYGGAACTWTGEMSMRAGTARYVVAQLESGKSAEAAAEAAVKDIATLRGGLLRTLVIHAIDRNGEAHVVAINADQPIEYGYWQEGMPQPERRKATPVTIPQLHQPS